MMMISVALNDYNAKTLLLPEQKYNQRAKQTRMKVTLEEMLMFSAVVECESFTAAAERLDMTTSVLSRAIKRLEGKLDCCLLHRTTRSVGMSVEGEWLYGRAAALLNQVDEVESYFLEDPRQPAGLIRVDAATPFTLHGLVPLIAEFNRTYPQITVVLESSESIINLVERKVDVAIRIGALENSSLKARRIGVTHRGIYASPDYLRRKGTPQTAAELQQHRCLGFTRPDKLNVWPVQDSHGDLVHITPSTLSDSGETLRQLALQGNGIACLSSFTVRQDIEKGALVALLAADIVEMPVPINLVFYSDKAVSGRVRCFIDYVAEHIVLSG